jgi:hypothetical protein
LLLFSCRVLTVIANPDTALEIIKEIIPCLEDVSSVFLFNKTFFVFRYDDILLSSLWILMKLYITLSSEHTFYLIITKPVNRRGFKGLFFMILG